MELWDCATCCVINTGTTCGNCGVRKDTIIHSNKTSPGTVRQFWECVECMSLNSTESESCIDCGTEHNVITSKSKGSQSWECQECTVMNTFGTESCSDCGTERYAITRETEEIRDYAELMKLALAENDKTYLLDLLNPEGQNVPEGFDLRDAVVELREHHGICLLSELCKYGHTDIIEILIHKGFILNQESSEGTPLQIACQYGHSHLVTQLLVNGAEIVSPNTPVWSEKSPFYLASRYGHLEVVRELLCFQPSMSTGNLSEPTELIKDEGIRSCLLQAACLGGNLDIVKIWCSPGMDISHPVEIVTSFSNCEQKTPLYAACEGDNIEVVGFLIELGAHITKEVICDFPDLIGKVIEDCVYESDDEFAVNVNKDYQEKLYCGNFKGRRLGGLHAGWLNDYIVTLVHLDISANKIEELPNAIPWDFPNLKYFTADNNNLKSIRSPDNLKVLTDMSLEEVFLSHNKLEDICHELFQIPSLKCLWISHNQLQYLVKSRHRCTGIQSNTNWNCPNLNQIDISYNCLEMLPPEFQMCTGLKRLIANNNKLHTFPSPWDCELGQLNLSNNCLQRFPASIEHFWCGTLRNLDLSNNNLEEINEGIVKLYVLMDLNVSRNEISHLPSADVWDCGELYHLDLSYNCLGEKPSDGPQKRKPAFTRLLKFGQPEEQTRFYTGLEFPECLANSLMELYLNNNHLSSVPLSVCHLRSLSVLDLSNNPGITKLPKQMGLLNSCGMLKLSGLEITNVPSNLLESGNTREIISYLRVYLRHSQKYYKLKLVVLGKKDKGKTTLVDLLGGKVGQLGGDIIGVNRREIELPPPKQKIFQKENRPVITFSVWDMAGDEVYSVINSCFFTPNSVYILVWDLSSISKEQNKLRKWIYNIKARTPNSKVIVVGTFYDRIKQCKDKYLEKLKEEINEMYSRENRDQPFHEMDPELFCAVSCITKEGIENLKQILYKVASTMPNPTNIQQSYLGRHVPGSYITMEIKVSEKLQSIKKSNRPPFITEEEFHEIIEEIPENDIDVIEERIAVTKFLMESGLLIHFDDQMKGLNSLYFLDPSWLCEILSKVLIDKDGMKIIRGGKIDMSDVDTLYREDRNFPAEFIPQCIKLLERFEIGILVDKDQKLFVPSKLPETHPGIDVSTDLTSAVSATIYRLYRMDYVPSGLWSRLLTRLMMKIEQFSSNEWWFTPKFSTIGRLSKGHRKASRTSSRAGLRFKLTEKVYWREGIWVRHDKGYFKVESVKRIHTERPMISQQGILIAVQSCNDDFSVMGIIVDEIDNIIQDHYPGLLDYGAISHKRFQRYAVCPNCYGKIEEEVPESLDHFSVEHCARLMLTCNTIPCLKGPRIPLSQLVPEYFMNELPNRLILDPDQLKFDEMQENCLGSGVTGMVYSGKYGNIDVAVKIYHSALKIRSENSSMDSGSHSMSSRGSQSQNTPVIVIEEEAQPDYDNWCDLTRNWDCDEAGSMKAWRAFSEMRQEVAVVSKLRHPCVISLIGVMFKPRLLMALELARYGSLRDVLEKELEQRESFNKYRARHKVFPLILGKDLTFKITLQIARALSYLHDSDIVYRDLKSDNILITSVDIDADVNVKVSDYGISKFGLSEGTVGLVGTPGYQAPEILEGMAYDEKVDIFSFAMVIFELMSGSRPFHQYATLSQMSKAIRLQNKRPSLKELHIESNFPYLEDLMERCWSSSSEKRPSASDIVSVNGMKSVQFICQHAEIKTQDDCHHGYIDAAVSVMCSPDDGLTSKPLLWFWEGQHASRKYSIIDLSVNRYHVHCMVSPGHRVTCMCFVNKEMWVGTEAAEIEVFGRGSVGPPSCQFRLDGLKSIPMAMLGDYVGTGETKNDHPVVEKVFVATEDGKLLIFQSVSKQTLSRHPSSPTKKVFGGWYEKKSLQLCKGSASCMVIEQTKSELWVGCSNQIVIVNTDTLLVETKLDILFRKIGNRHFPRNVSNLVYSGDRIWCQILGSAEILEFDSKEHLLLHTFECSKTFPLYSVLTDVPPDTLTVELDSQAVGRSTDHDEVCQKTERSTLAMKDDVGVCCDAAVELNCETESPFMERGANRHPAGEIKPEQDSFCDSYVKIIELPIGVFHEDPSVRTTRNNASVLHDLKELEKEFLSKTPCSVRSGNDEKSPENLSLPPPIPPKNRLKPNERKSSYYHTNSECNNNDSDVPLPKPFTLPLEKRTAFRHKTISQACPSKVFSTGDNLPPIPPPSPRHLTRTGSDVPPPEVPPRSNRPLTPQVPKLETSFFLHQRQIIVKSLAVVGNTLWVGRSSGDILIINLSSNSNFEEKEVIGILKPVHQINSEANNGSRQIMKLLHVGHLVVSMDANFNCENCSTRIVAWEDYDSNQIYNINQYWGKIRNAEKQLLCEDIEVSEEV
ncbi:hypothetical protein ScPMuIL_017499 [Solemya velum]